MSILNEIKSEYYQEPNSYTQDEVIEIIKQATPSGNKSIALIKSRTTDILVDWLKEEGFNVEEGQAAVPVYVVSGWA